MDDALKKLPIHSTYVLHFPCNFTKGCVPSFPHGSAHPCVAKPTYLHSITPLQKFYQSWADLCLVRWVPPLICMCPLVALLDQPTHLHAFNWTRMHAFNQTFPHTPLTEFMSPLTELTSPLNKCNFHYVCISIEHVYTHDFNFLTLFPVWVVSLGAHKLEALISSLTLKRLSHTITPSRQNSIAKTKCCIVSSAPT